MKDWHPSSQRFYSVVPISLGREIPATARVSTHPCRTEQNALCRGFCFGKGPPSCCFSPHAPAFSPRQESTILFCSTLACLSRVWLYQIFAECHVFVFRWVQLCFSSAFGLKHNLLGIGPSWSQLPFGVMLKVDSKAPLFWVITCLKVLETPGRVGTPVISTNKAAQGPGGRNPPKPSRKLPHITRKHI